MVSVNFFLSFAALQLLCFSASCLGEKFTVPEAPTNVQASKVEGESITLTWQAPISDKPIFYVLKYRMRDEYETPEYRRGITSTNFTVYDLFQNAEYEFQVSAGHYPGWGPEKAAPTIYVKTITDPLPATNLQASNITATSVFLTWEAPPSPRAPVYYDIRYKLNSTAPNTIKSYKYVSGIVSTRCGLPNLSPNTKYDIDILSGYKWYSGPTSVSNVVYVTTEKTSPPTKTTTDLPAPPTNVKASEITPKSVLLTWEAPKSSGSYHYMIRHKHAAAGPEWYQYFLGVLSPSFNVTQLHPNIEYEFTVFSERSPSINLGPTAAGPTIIVKTPDQNKGR